MMSTKEWVYADDRSEALYQGMSLEQENDNYEDEHSPM